jgi:hypothetical protein
VGVERLARAAEARRGKLPIPWISVPRDQVALSGIVEVIDMIPRPEHSAIAKFWDSLSAHVGYMLSGTNV